MHSSGVFLLGHSRTLASLRGAIRQAQPGLYVAGEAASLARGLRVLRHCPCSVVAVDIAGTDGAWLQALRDSTDARIVIVASSGADEGVERALRAGADGVLCSSDPGDALVRALRRVIEGEVGLCDRQLGEFFMQAVRRAVIEPGMPRARLSGAGAG